MGIPADAIAFQNVVLDGTFRSDVAPADLLARLWFDNPEDDSPTEADFGGYTPATVAKADWGAASGGVIATTDLVAFGTPSSDASGQINYWSLHDSTTDELVYAQPVSNPTRPTAGGSAFQIRPVVPYGFNN